MSNERKCRDAACVDGYIHEDGEASACWVCSTSAGLDDALDAMATGCRFQNRAIRRAARAGRHARAVHLIERHEERFMFRALAAQS